MCKQWAGFLSRVDSYLEPSGPRIGSGPAPYWTKIWQLVDWKGITQDIMSFCLRYKYMDQTATTGII